MLVEIFRLWRKRWQQRVVRSKIWLLSKITIKNINQDSTAKTNELDKIRTFGWNQLEYEAPLFFGLDPVTWVAETILTAKLRTSFELQIQQNYTLQQLILLMHSGKALEKLPFIAKMANIMEPADGLQAPNYAQV